MRIKNLDKVKEILKAKLPEYIKSLGLTIDKSKLQCPNHAEAHKHGDKGKLSAAFLPKTNNSIIWCFVEDRKFDIFDVYSIQTGKDISGKNFYTAIKELAKIFSIPLDIEDTYSIPEKTKDKKREALEALHRISLKNIKLGVPFYKERNLNKEKIKYWKIGFISPDLITKELNDVFKNLFEYSLKGIITHPALLIPILNENKQYAGVVIRQFGCSVSDRYLNISIEGKNLFNICNLRGKEHLYIVEGVFDAIALYPETNVVAVLTNSLHDKDLEYLAKIEYNKITIALDEDNWKQGSKRDGIFKTIMKLRNISTDVEIIHLPKDSDPDSFIKEKGLQEFKDLPRITAIDYLIENFQEKLIPIEELYRYVSGCPDIVKTENLINHICKQLSLGKRQMVREIEGAEVKSDNINLVDYVEEKEHFTNMLEDFTEAAWSKEFQGIKTGFPIFDNKVGGFEDTLYLYIGRPEQGKTAVLLNFTYMLASQPDTFVAFYSLDDGAKRAIVPRLMSMASGLSTKIIRDPEPDIEKAWQTGLAKLHTFKDSLIIKDGGDIQSVADLDKYIKLHYNIAREKNKKFVVVIDNVHALTSSSRFEANENTQRIAAYLKKIPQAMHCPIIGTAEVPKSASQIPEGKDIKESIDLWYSARFVGSIVSAAHAKGESNLLWRPEGNASSGKMMPIIQLYISKNQTGQLWHGNLYYKLNWNNNKLTECTEEESKRLADGQYLYD